MKSLDVLVESILVSILFSRIAKIFIESFDRMVSNERSVSDRYDLNIWIVSLLVCWFLLVEVWFNSLVAWGYCFVEVLFSIERSVCVYRLLSSEHCVLKNGTVAVINIGCWISCGILIKCHSLHFLLPLIDVLGKRTG